MAYNISYIYEVIDRFSPALKRINAASEKFKSGITKSQASLKRFSERAGNVQNALAGIGAGAAMAFTAGKAMEFEDVMADVQKVVTFTADNTFANFKETVMKTGVELGKTPKAIAQIAVQGGKLGVLPENMKDFIGVVARTSVAFDMLEGTAAEQIGSIQAKLGMTVGETGNLMDAVNYLADNTAAGGAKMIEVIARTSGTLKTLNMPAKFMAGWAAFADQVEVTPQLAASGMNMMISKMSQMPGMLEKMVASPNEAIKGLLVRLSQLDQVQKTKAVQQLFGPEAGRFVLKAVNNIQLLDKTLGLVSDQTAFAGSMMKELQTKLGTGKTAWAQMKAVIDVMAITLGDVLMPHIKAAAPVIVKAGLAFRQWAKAHPTLVKIGLAIGAAVAVAAPLLVFFGMVAGAVAAISAPMVAFGAAFAAVGAAVWQVWQNWDYLVADFKAGLAFLGDLFAKVFRFTPVSVAIKTLRGDFGGLMEDVRAAFDLIKQFTPTKIGKKVAGFFGLGPKEMSADEKFKMVMAERRRAKETGLAAAGAGVAAQNAVANKGVLNGEILVSAKQGAAVERAGMRTDVPGNLGFNIAGAY